MGIISTYAGNLIVGYGDTKRFMYYQLLATIIQIALLFALTPLFGANGVLLGLFVISEVIIDMLFVYALHRQFDFSQKFNSILKLVIPSIILVALLYYATASMNNSKWALVTNLFGVIILFPPLAAVFGGVKKENLEFVRDIANSLRLGFIAKYILQYTQFFIRE